VRLRQRWVFAACYSVEPDVHLRLGDVKASLKIIPMRVFGFSKKLRAPLGAVREVAKRVVHQTVHTTLLIFSDGSQAILEIVIELYGCRRAGHPVLLGST